MKKHLKSESGKQNRKNNLDVLPTDLWLNHLFLIDAYYQEEYEYFDY